MNLIELYKQIGLMITADPRKCDYEVVIPNNKPSVGPIAATGISGIFPGIDWDRGKIFIYPEYKMTEL